MLGKKIFKAAAHRRTQVQGLNRLFSSGASPVSIEVNPTIDAQAKECFIPTYNADGKRTLKDTCFTSGKGVYLYDQHDSKYLDFSAGIAVSILGYANSAWAAAVADQAMKIGHTSNLFHTSPPLELAQTLISNSTFDKVFFCNSGTEANEAAYKFTRLFANARKKSSRNSKVIAFKGGFHGRTAGALSLTYKPAIRDPFMPLLPNIEFADFNNLSQVAEIFKNNTDDVAGVFVEPIQGEGGINVATPEFLQGLRDLCTSHNALLVCDEVQCGLGRTGTLFCHEAYGIRPDIVTLAKPLAGGLPIGAVLTTNAVASHITPGTHGSTFGGNPIVCKSALVVMDALLNEDLLQNVCDRGSELASGLNSLAEKYPDVITDVRTPLNSTGLLCGIECKSSDVVNSIITNAAISHKILLISAGTNVIRLCPPLVVTSEQVQQVLSVLNILFLNAKSTSR